MSSEVSHAKAADHLRPADPEQGPTAEWGGADGPGLRAPRKTAGQEGRAPGRPAHVQPPGFSLDASPPCVLVFIRLSLRGRGVWAPCPACTPPLHFTRTFYTVCLGLPWFRHAAVASSFLSLGLRPALCLTKPVHCFLFIAQDSGGGRPAWGGGREAGTSLGMDEIMSALFFNFFK